MGKRKICPKCSANRPARIIYGLIPVEALKTIRGDFELGGCCFDQQSPTILCRDCNYQWGSNMATDWDIATLEATISGYLGQSIEVKLDLSHETITYCCRENPIYGHPIDYKEIPLTNVKRDLLIKTLHYCDFVDWLGVYNNNSVLDGRQWRVELELNDGTKISKHSSNSYPGRWNYFCRKLSELAEKRFS